jgi:hypothetical protein
MYFNGSNLNKDLGVGGFAPDDWHPFFKFARKKPYARWMRSRPIPRKHRIQDLDWRRPHDEPNAKRG